MLGTGVVVIFFFFSSRRRHTRYWRDWSSDVCSSDLNDTNNYGIYQYADVGFDRGYSQLTYAAVASTNISWEIARKRDLGLDFSMWHDNFSGTIDLFSEERTGIYQVRSYLPDIVGLTDLTTAPA